MATGSDSAMRRLDLDLGRRRGCGRSAERQGEREMGAAAQAVRGDDRALMRLDDRARDGEAQPHAGRRGFALAAGEFLEDRLLPALRQARAVIRYRDLEPLAG